MKIPNKTLYKWELNSTKFLPIVIAFVYICSITFSYFGIESRIFSIIGGMSILPLLRIYQSSWTYKLCTHHRMFIYYIAICTIIDIIDFYTEGELFGDRDYYLLNFIIFGITLVMYIVMKRRYDFSHKSSSKIPKRHS